MDPNDRYISTDNHNNKNKNNHNFSFIKFVYFNFENSSTIRQLANERRDRELNVCSKENCFNLGIEKATAFITILLFMSLFLILFLLIVWKKPWIVPVMVSSLPKRNWTRRKDTLNDHYFFFGGGGGKNTHTHTQ